MASFTPRPLYLPEKQPPVARAGVDDMQERRFLTLPGLELRPLGRPTRSQSLYRLHYPSHKNKLN
jgi:hypothetical protein